MRTTVKKIEKLRNSAKSIYHIGGNRSISNYKYCSEEFFKTEDGKYFILGEGGAGSPYRTGTSSATYKGARMIVPVSKEWAEKRIEMDKKGYTYIHALEEFVSNDLLS